MATDEMPNDRFSTPSVGVPQSSDDDELLLYLYEKSSDSKTKCYDCISMGGPAPMCQDSVEQGPGSDRELLSRSTEQICSRTLSLAGPTTQVAGVVRSCRSQENYFELCDMICVDIDIDENLASSVDALHYRESVVSRTSDLSGSVDTVELESVDQSVPTTTPEDNKTSDEPVEPCSTVDLNCSSDEQENRTLVVPEPSLTEEREPIVLTNCSDVDQQDGDDVVDGKLLSDEAATGCEDEGELQSRACLKDADRPSAARLAKRLFYLDGFRKSDVSPHLSKKSVNLNVLRTLL